MVCVKVCKECNKEFIVNSNRQLICDDCRDKLNRVKPIKCKWCGEVFIPKHKTIKYCSDDCKVLAKLKYDRSYFKMVSKMKARAGTLALPLFKPDFDKEAKVIKQLMKSTFSGVKNTDKTSLNFGNFNGDVDDCIDYDKELLVIDDVDEFFLDNTIVDVDNDKVDVEEYANWVLSNSEY
jgi:hypothetical protein